MKRLHVIGSALVAVFALSAVMASAALAGPQWYKEGTAIPAGVKDKMTASGGPFDLETKVIGQEIVVECKSLTITNGLAENTSQKSGVDSGKITFKECKGVKNCTLTAAEEKEIETLGEKSELGEELKGPKPGAWVDIFYPNAAGEFAKIDCGLFGASAVTSTTGYACEWAAGHETPALSHELICPTRKATAPFCEKNIEEVKKWNSEKLVTNLTFFGAKTEFCGKSQVELLEGLTKINWDIRT